MYTPPLGFLFSFLVRLSVHTLYLVVQQFFFDFQTLNKQKKHVEKRRFLRFILSHNNDENSTKFKSTLFPAVKMLLKTISWENLKLFKRFRRLCGCLEIVHGYFRWYFSLYLTLFFASRSWSDTCVGVFVKYQFCDSYNSSKAPYMRQIWYAILIRFT